MYQNTEIIIEIPLDKLRFTITQTQFGTKAFLGFTQSEFKEFIDSILKAHGEKVK
jgi:hypothetical protein